MPPRSLFVLTKGLQAIQLNGPISSSSVIYPIAGATKLCSSLSAKMQPQHTSVIMQLWMVALYSRSMSPSKVPYSAIIRVHNAREPPKTSAAIAMRLKTTFSRQMRRLTSISAALKGISKLQNPHSNTPILRVQALVPLSCAITDAHPRRAINSSFSSHLEGILATSPLRGRPSRCGRSTKVESTSSRPFCRPCLNSAPPCRPRPDRQVTAGVSSTRPPKRTPTR